MENHRFDPLTSMIFSDDFPSYNAIDQGIPSSPCLIVPGPHGLPAGSFGSALLRG
jgi:hypothetical protein